MAKGYKLLTLREGKRQQCIKQKKVITILVFQHLSEKENRISPSNYGTFELERIKKLANGKFLNFLCMYIKNIKSDIPSNNCEVVTLD